MPPVDLETLVSVCGGGACDRKIACETLADGDRPMQQVDLPEAPPDLPPESFWLSKDAEIDWFDRNAFYERKESQKGNSVSANSNPNPNPSPGSNPNSQRFSLSLKSKASIFGLPKPQKSCFLDAKLRRTCRPANTRLFPKRSQPEGKTTVPMTEPSSPKVSCMGRVRSKKDRSLRLRSWQRKSEATKEEAKSCGKRRSGFWTSFGDLFRSCCRETTAAQVDESPKESPPRKNVDPRAHYFSATKPANEPPALGGVKRFASGRRSDSWGVVDADLESDAAKSDACDRDSVWERRGMGPAKEVDCRRQMESVGPATV